MPYTTLPYVGRIDGGTALQHCPGPLYGRDFEIRNIAGDDAGGLLDRLMNEAAAIAGRDVATPSRKPILASRCSTTIRAWPRRRTQRWCASLAGSSHPKISRRLISEQRAFFWKRLGVPVVVCGPGSMDQGHKLDEFIALDQLEACDRMMERLLQCCL